MCALCILMCSECLLTTGCSAVLGAHNVLMLNGCINSGFLSLFNVKSCFRNKYSCSILFFYLVRIKHYAYTSACGPGSSVGIATGYDLDGPEIESRWGRDFSQLSRRALGLTHGTRGTVSFPGVKSGRGVTLTRHPLLVPLVVKE